MTKDIFKERMPAHAAMQLRCYRFISGKLGSGAKAFFCTGVMNLFLLFAAQGQAQYALIELQGLRSQLTVPVAINNGGEVIGYYVWNDSVGFGDSRHSFIYRAGALHDLGTLTYLNNSATALNNFGQVVGHYDFGAQGNGNESPYGYFHSSNGTVTLLGSKSPVYTMPEAINDCGTIVGAGSDSYLFSAQKAFVYRGGQVTGLSPFQGQIPFDAPSINNRGQILALIFGSTGRRTLIYSGDQIQEIGLVNGSEGTQGLKINDHGVVLGTYFTYPGGQGYFLYRNGQIQDLGLHDHRFTSMNNKDQIVGYLGDPNFTGTAIVSDGIIDHDLNTLIGGTAGVHLVAAWGINDSGQICASGTNAAGVYVGFLLTPKR